MKKIIITTSLILLVLSLAGFYLHNSHEAEHFQKILLDDIHDRSFFKEYDIQATQKDDDELKLHASQIPRILSYQVHHHLFVNQAPTDQSQNNQIQDLVIKANCDVQSIYDSKENTFEIAVSYSNINKTDSTGKLQMGQSTFISGAGGRRVLQEASIELDAAKYGGTHTISQDGESITGEFPNGHIQYDERNDRFFLLHVEGSSGQVTGLKAENGIEEDTIVNWMTQQLVNDILPDLRKASYEQEVHQDDNLGILKINLNHQHTNDNHIHIEKSYDNQNYVSTYVQNITLPQQNYLRNIKLNKDGGIAHSSNSTFTFSHGSNGNQDGTDEIKEALGMVHGHVKQNFQLVESTEDADHLASEMWRYRNEAEFHSCHLYQANKASFKLGNGDSKPFQTEAFLEPNQETEAEGDEFTDYFYDEKLAQEMKEIEEVYQKEIRQEKEDGFLSGKRRKLDFTCWMMGNDDCAERERARKAEEARQVAARKAQAEREAQIRAAAARAEAQRRAAEKRAKEEFARQMAAKKAAEKAQKAKEAQEAKEREEELKRERNDAVYSHVKKLASVKVFGSEIHVDSDYVVKYDTSSIHIDVMVNSHVVDTLFKIEWENCKTKPNNWNQEKDITLFQVTFPLLGIIVIPVTAKVRLEYGYNSGLTAAARKCEFDFNPYFKGSLFASGEASILHVISAGIYAQGTFLDANLDFKIGSDSGKSYTSLEGNFKAFTLSIGAVYDKFHCSLSNAWSTRRLESVDGPVAGGKLGRRALWPHWHFLKKIVHKIRKIVHKVIPFVNKAIKVIRNIQTKGFFKTFCDKSKGYKQIYSKASPSQHKVFFNKEIDIGL